MIIHTRKYRVIERESVLEAKANSKRKKKTTADRRAFLETVRSNEKWRKENNLSTVPINKVSSFFGIEGVYFLYDGDKLIYIGETSCLMSRLLQHQMDKQFDSFRILLEKDPEKRLALEKRNIKLYAPTYNIVHNPMINNKKAIIRTLKDLSQINL